MHNMLVVYINIRDFAHNHLARMAASGIRFHSVMTEFSILRRYAALYYLWYKLNLCMKSAYGSVLKVLPLACSALAIRTIFRVVTCDYTPDFFQ